jgi:type IV secretion system protein VirD4
MAVRLTNPLRLLGWNRETRRAVNSECRRILGFSLEEGSPIFEPNSSASSLIVGATGGGKTTCVSIPAIMSMLSEIARALLINDVKDGEMAWQIARMCRKYGRKFAVIDDSHVLGADYPYRISINPFGGIVSAYKTQNPDLQFIIENAVHTLIEEPVGDAKNKFFRDGPRGFLTFGIRALLERKAELATPGALASLIADRDTWNAIVDQEAEDGTPLMRMLAGQIKELKEFDPEHYSMHMLSALTALSSFQLGSPLHEAGRAEEITHEELIRDGWVVCIVQSQRNAGRLGAYYGLHILSFMNAQMSGDVGKADYILDEFCAAPLKPVIRQLTTIRAYGGRFILIAQSRADIQNQYGEKETAMLEENCTVKQYLKFSNFEEAERISKSIGEVESLQQSLGFSSDKPEFSGNFSTGRERIFTAEELLRLPPDQQILHIAGVGFVHCKKVRQNEIAPYCFDLDVNPLEGGILEPDPKVTLAVPKGTDQ